MRAACMGVDHMLMAGPVHADLPQAVRLGVHVRGRLVEGASHWLGVGGILTPVSAAACSPDRLAGLAAVWGPVAQALAPAASRQAECS